MKIHTNRLGSFILTAVFIAGSAFSNADPAKGRAIFESVDAAESGYVDSSVDLKMVLVSRKGKTTQRALTIRQLEVPTDADKALFVFHEPKTISGTGLLSHGHKEQSDDQWLFVPSLKRVKKISSRDKSGPFVGSEFSYEDLSQSDVDDFTYFFLREEECGELTCAVVERTPIDKFSGYSKQTVWVDLEAFRIHRIDYLDRKGQPLKQLTASEFRQYGNGQWKAHILSMDNLKSGRKTDLIWGNFEFENGYTDTRDFSTNALRRAR